MKIPLAVKSILTGLAMTLAGCNLGESPPDTEAKSEKENQGPRPGPAAPPGPIQPAPEPHLPATTKYDPKQDEAAKPAEARPEEKKDEPKLETPK